MTNIESKPYFITGCSTGIGFNLLIELLKKGHKVAATTRDKNKLIEKVKSCDSTLINENFLPLEMDLSSKSSIEQAVNETIKKFNSIYCLINNAGFFCMGTVEELNEEDVKSNFDINVFGLINVIKYIVPGMRENHHAEPRILNISSIAGYYGNILSGIPIYAASKYAVDGLSNALARDLDEFNIKVISVLPGYFRTNFFNCIAEPKNPIIEYKSVRSTIDSHRGLIGPGNPLLGARAIIEVSEMKNPPLNFFLGKDSVKFAEEKIASIKKDIDVMRKLSCSTDHEN